MDKFQVVSKLDFFTDLLLGFEDLALESFDFVGEFFDLNFLLPEFVLTILDDLLSFDFTRSGIFTVD